MSTTAAIFSQQDPSPSNSTIYIGHIDKGWGTKYVGIKKLHVSKDLKMNTQIEIVR